MSSESMAAKIARHKNPVEMLRSTFSRPYPFPIPREYTNWRDEQEAWRSTAVLFDQSHHMTDIYFRGPDVKRLLSDFGVNNFASFGRNRAKQFVACNEEGRVLGDAILFGLEDDQFSLVGVPTVPNWMAYNAEIGGYDVEVRRDERSATINQAGRTTFRYQLQGPAALQIVEKASRGVLPPIKFFSMGEFRIAGVGVRALNHTMTGIPGHEFTGLEMWGPVEQRRAVLDALLDAGAEFGMVQGGAVSYGTTPIESGWIGLPVPALYTSPGLQRYREHLSGDAYEASALGGSYDSDDIEDYYLTPWELGYGRLIHFDHEFLGRDALLRLADEPHRKKVWLMWNADDVSRVMAASLFDTADRPRYIDVPGVNYATFQYDRVTVGGRQVGVSTKAGYTANARSFCSLAMLDEAEAREGAEVELLWGEPDGGAAKPNLEAHVQATIRATVRTTAP
jgi:glycine cleavage system aminomethyltransferase T